MCYLLINKYVYIYNLYIKLYVTFVFIKLVQATEYAVLMNIKTPREWNDKAVADALKDYERISDKQDIKTKFVREGSLIILTAVPYDILHDKVKYEHAIKMFLTRIMDVCNIDTERACQVKATLHKLEVDEGKLLFN